MSFVLCECCGNELTGADAVRHKLRKKLEEQDHKNVKRATRKKKKSKKTRLQRNRHRHHHHGECDPSQEQVDQEVQRFREALLALEQEECRKLELSPALKGKIVVVLKKAVVLV